MWGPRYKEVSGLTPKHTSKRNVTKWRSAYQSSPHAENRKKWKIRKEIFSNTAERSGNVHSAIIVFHVETPYGLPVHTSSRITGLLRVETAHVVPRWISSVLCRFFPVSSCHQSVGASTPRVVLRRSPADIRNTSGVRSAITTILWLPDIR